MESKALSNILERNSPRQLIEPHPNPEQMKLVYEAALRAPDHGWIRPTRFIEVSGDGLKKLSNILSKNRSSKFLARLFTVKNVMLFLLNYFLYFFKMFFVYNTT